MFGRSGVQGAVVAAVVVAALAGGPAIGERIADYARDADRVDGLDSSSLVRAGAAARTGHLDDFYSRGFVTVVRKRVVAPVGGIVLAWGYFSAEWDSDSDPGSFARLAARMRIDDRTIAPARRFEIGRSTLAGTQAIALGGAIPVRAGRHSLTVQIRRTEGTALTHIYPRNVQTLFVPFGNDGRKGVLD